ncbi:MAG: ADP-ribosylation factor-like protein [Promethearchaeota archaeon]
MMRGLILSYFDNIIGPKVFLKEPEDLDISHLGQITELMNLYRKGFFLHEFGGLKSANLMFNLPNKHARGGVEILMITIIVTGEREEIDYKISKSYLGMFVDQLLREKKISQAFHESGGAQFDKLKTLFSSFYQSFPDISFVNTRKASLFIYGLSKAGKTTIVQALHNKKFKEKPPTISMDISDLRLDNLSIMVYDAPGQTQYRELWTPHLTGQDGLVFVLDVKNESSYVEAGEIMRDIASKPSTRTLPLLLLLNKIDLKKPKISLVKKKMKLNEINNRPFKYFETSGKKAIGIAEAFNWLTGKLVDGSR